MSKPIKQWATMVVLMSGLVGLTGCSQIKDLFVHQKTVPKAKAPAPVIVYGLDDLDHRVADHATPDALVYIAPGYDRKKPIRLVIYNHGMMTNLKDVEDTWKIAEQMKQAAPNTVLVAPEWAVNPKALSDKAGDFHKPGFFKDMLAEIFAKVPELQGRSLNDVSYIQLSSFSGGLYALVTELSHNGLEDKVRTITLYDSLYRGNALDPWLQKNIADIATGKKQYFNFYFHTYPQSLQQLGRIKKMLAAKNLGLNCLRCDTADPYSVMPAQKVATRSIVFKSTMANIDKTFTGHMATARTYIPVVLKAQALRDSGFTEADLRKQQMAERKKQHENGVHRYM